MPYKIFLLTINILRNELIYCTKKTRNNFDLQTNHQKSISRMSFITNILLKKYWSNNNNKYIYSRKMLLSKLIFIICKFFYKGTVMRNQQNQAARPLL